MNKKLKEWGLKWKIKHIRNCNWRIRLKKKQKFYKSNMDKINKKFKEWGLKLKNNKQRG
jgi:hypothetical protein